MSFVNVHLKQNDWGSESTYIGEISEEFIKRHLMTGLAINFR